MDTNKGEQSALGTREGMGERKHRENARDPSPTGVPPLACLPGLDGGAVDTSAGTLRAQSQQQARNDFNSQFEYQQLIPLQFWGDEYARKQGIRGNMNAGDLEDGGCVYLFEDFVRNVYEERPSEIELLPTAMFPRLGS